MGILRKRLDRGAKFYGKACESILNFKFLCGAAGLPPEGRARLVPPSAARCLTTALPQRPLSPILDRGRRNGEQVTSTPIAEPQAHVGAMPILGLLGSMLSVQVGAAFAKSLFRCWGRKARPC